MSIGAETLNGERYTAISPRINDRSFNDQERAGWFVAMEEMREWHEIRLANSAEAQREAHRDALSEIQRLMKIEKSKL